MTTCPCCSRPTTEDTPCALCLPGEVLRVQLLAETTERARVKKASRPARLHRLKSYDFRPDDFDRKGKARVKA